MSATCPTSAIAVDGTSHTIIGCGSTNVTRDDDGVYDCLDCGIFWTARWRPACNGAGARPWFLVLEIPCVIVDGIVTTPAKVTDYAWRAGTDETQLVRWKSHAAAQRAAEARNAEEER